MRRPMAIEAESTFLDSFAGALVGAGAAADTDIGIDDVLVLALGDRLNGALVGTGAALHASVSDFESHGIPSYVVNLHVIYNGKSILTWIRENAIPFLKKCRIFFSLAGQNFSEKGGILCATIR